jgi:hypothetical protein
LLVSAITVSPIPEGYDILASSCPRDVFVAVREWQLPFLNSLYCNIVAQLSAQLLERHVGFN